MLNPKVDLVFKKLFCVEENKDILMSFLVADFSDFIGFLNKSGLI